MDVVIGRGKYRVKATIPHIAAHDKDARKASTEDLTMLIMGPPIGKSTMKPAEGLVLPPSMDRGVLIGYGKKQGKMGSGSVSKASSIKDPNKRKGTRKEAIAAGHYKKADKPQKQERA